MATKAKSTGPRDPRSVEAIAEHLAAVSPAYRAEVEAYDNPDTDETAE